MRSISFFVSVLSFVICQSVAEAGEVRGRVDCTTFKGVACLLKGLALKGTIDDAMTEKLVRLFVDFRRQAGEQKLPEDISHTEIKLNSPGGSVTAAMAIGRLLRKYRMTALVGSGAVCNSACVLIYAGAVNRIRNVNTGGIIGIHQPFFEVPGQSIDVDVIRKNYTSMLQDMKSYLHEMNVSEQLADEMLKTPTNSMRYLTNEEQDQFGLLITDPIEAEISDLEQAKELGISRSELMRRQVLLMKECYPRYMASGDTSCSDVVMKTGKLPVPNPDLDYSGLVPAAK